MFSNLGRRFLLPKLIITCMLISGWSIYCVASEKQNKRKQAQGARWITKALANALVNALTKNGPTSWLIFINVWLTRWMVHLSLSGTVEVEQRKWKVKLLYFFFCFCACFHFFFRFIFALTRSALSILILFNDYFLCYKHCMCLVKLSCPCQYFIF